MERIQLINPDRIAWCCADHGITPEILASELDIAETSIERVMAGEAGLTFGQLRRMADYFGRGVLFFLEASPVSDELVHTLQFRTLANQKPELSAKLKNLIERVEQQRNVYLNLLEELNEADERRFVPPQISGLEIPEAARVAREWLHLGATNDFEDYRRAVESRGILVFRTNGYNGKWQIAKESPILGFTLYDVSCPVIVIKKRFETQQAFTLIHELGHLLLHKTSSIDDEQDFQSHQGREQDANAFAGHLLVPDEFLQHIHDIDRPEDVSRFDEWLETPRKNWGVSTEMILRRLLDIGRLSQGSYVAYRNWWAESVAVSSEQKGTRKYRHREPKHVFGDTFVRTVLDALDARHITLARASTYLDNLKISDLHQLERHLADV
ncbi:MAG: ImmA/IrrE family metallo-endopeptidase [Methyloglobulus sp.]|nr:ImmA/IrrE family metallo-endopeptidase [Methyloglobulus sp.]